MFIVFERSSVDGADALVDRRNGTLKSRSVEADVNPDSLQATYRVGAVRLSVCWEGLSFVLQSAGEVVPRTTSCVFTGE